MPRDKNSPATQRPAARRIGLLGGSFNPAHEGHREISLKALETLTLDAVWWLVTPGNPLKNPDDYADYEERLHTARAVANHPDIIVSDFERRRNLQYTVETLESIRDANPEAAFVWLMGADSLASFHRWKDWRRIAELAPIAVFNRPGHESAALDSPAGKALDAFRIDRDDGDLLSREPPAWQFVDDTSNPVSSTEIRASRNPEKDQNLTVTDLHAPYGDLAFFLDLHPDLGNFRSDVIEGLSRPEKSLSPKYFYDERGSKLFEEITSLEEYYPTRTEKSIFMANGREICDAIGRQSAVLEYGSGSSEKIDWLLNGLDRPAAYVAMDISKEHLIDSAATIAARHDVPVAAICADFHEAVEIPAGPLPPADRWLGYFPGSTLGNMTPENAVHFLRRASETLGRGAKFLLGVDLEKDRAILEAAYDDRKGVTAAFNLNLLDRMQRDLGAKLSAQDFEHHAFYNKEKCRIEMHLRALRPTMISIDGTDFSFAKGETLHTENSHKYSVNRLESLFSETPWRHEATWTDDNHWFAACLLSNS